MVRKTVAGVLPDEWKGTLIKNICRVVRGSSPRPAGSPLFFDGKFLPWATVADLTNSDDMYLTSTKSMLTEAGAERTRITDPGTLMLTNSGATLGVPKISSIRCGANDGIAMLLELDGIVTEYAYYYLASKTQYFRDVIAPGVGQPNLNTDLIGDFPIPMPPLAEQKKIAQILSTWDKAIATTEQLLANSQQQKKALMQQLLTGKKRFSGFSGKWESAHLCDMVKIAKGKALSSRGLIDGEIPVIAGGKSSPYKHRHFSHEDVITVSASGAYAGYVSYHPYKIWASDCSVIVAREGSDTGYIYQLLTFRQNEIYSLQSGGAQPHIYPKDLESLKVFFPSLSEQKAISSLLIVCDKELKTLLKKLHHLKQEKKALMQQLLTGKRRVKVDAA